MIHNLKVLIIVNYIYIYQIYKYIYIHVYLSIFRMSRNEQLNCSFLDIIGRIRGRIWTSPELGEYTTTHKCFPFGECGRP